MLTTQTRARTSFAAFLPNLVLSRYSPERTESRCFILNLPLDIHVDHIFIYLHVEDIICLRRVNKAFFLLTHEPIIWKRFLERMNIPLPPLRPTFRYSLQATDFEIEQLVTRSISLDDNWRQAYPSIRGRQLLATHLMVLAMKLLPGGKFLVASEKDASSYRYFLTIYSLDNPKGPLALARVGTETKAFHLQAKYMVLNGKQGIMVAFVRRKFKHGPLHNVNPSDYGVETELDPPDAFVYESLCLHTALDSLEHLSDPGLPRGPEYVARAANQTPPFRSAALIGSSHPIEGITLFDYNERPYVAFIQQPDKVVIKNLTSQVLSTLVCEKFDHFPDMHQHINTIRILPGQKDILVIRTVTVTDPRPNITDNYLVEIYDAPQVGGATVRGAKERCIIDGKNIASFHVSDHGIPTMTNDHPKLRQTFGPPPPISVYGRTIKPNGLVHYTIWPTHVQIPATATAGPKTSYYYSLNIVTIQSVHLSDPYTAHILPGANRAMIYTTPSDDRTDTPSLVSLRKYINPETQPSDYPMPEEDKSDILRKPRLGLPHCIFSSFRMPRIWSEKLGNGVAAITWDEGIGRVCIAAKDETMIRILDFADMVHPDARFAAWKKQQVYLSKS